MKDQLQEEQDKAREEKGDTTPIGVKSAEKTQMDSGATPIESTSLVNREKYDVSQWQLLNDTDQKEVEEDTTITGIQSYMKSTGKDPWVRPKGESAWKRATFVLKDQVFERAWDPEFPVPGTKTGSGTDVVQSPTPKTAAKNMEEAEKASEGSEDSTDAEDSASEGTNPVENLNATDAADKVSRMRSKDRLKFIADNDARSSVKSAAQKRLEEMGE